MTDQVAAYGWNWVVRVQDLTRLLLRGHPEVPIRTMCHEPLLVSNLGGIAAIRHAYGRRYAIEALFRDWKTAGWQWEARQSRGQSTQEALDLGMALATMLVLLIGMAAA